MKKFALHINLFLSMLMLAASVMPALHAVEHIYADQNSSEKHPVGIHDIHSYSTACDLCDFNFSSSDVPEFFDYDLSVPVKNHLRLFSARENLYLTFPASFSLRAPPAAAV